MNNNTNNNTHLFNLIWKNKYLKNHIFYFIRVYKIFKYPRVFYSIKSYQEYKHKEYIDMVIIENYNFNKNENENEILLDNIIPQHINTLYIGAFKFTKIPSWITTIRMEYQSYENLKILFGDYSSNDCGNGNCNENCNGNGNCNDNCSGNGNGKSTTLTSNIQSIWFCRNNHVTPQEIPIGILPNSITSLKLDNYNFQVKKGVLPNSLKSLELIIGKRISEAYKEDFFQPESLPSSITSLKISAYYIINNQNYPININVLPPSIERLTVQGFSFYSSSQLSNIIDSDNKNNDSTFYFPKSIKYLSLCLDSNTNFKLHDGVEVFHIFSESVNALRSISLPDSITEIAVGSNNWQIITTKMFPKNIKFLTLNNFEIDNDDLDNISLSALPSSIEKLILSYNIRHRNNLQLLQFQLPSLTSLTISLNGTLNSDIHSLDMENIFPNSLTYISLDLEIPIGVNLFPKSGSLKTIILSHRFNSPIHPKSIPSSVEVLQINNHQYNHIIEFPNIDNNPNILVKVYNIIYYLNNFNSNPSILKKLFIPVESKQYYSKFNLKRFTNLEYLEICNGPNQPLLSEDFPTSIKTFSIDCIDFKETFNLEDFQQLETIIINNSSPKLITTKINNNFYNNNTQYNNNNHENAIYNFYNLKSIIVNNINTTFLDSLDNHFYPFVKIKKIL